MDNVGRDQPDAKSNILFCSGGFSSDAGFYEASGGLHNINGNESNFYE